jgi:hypothetical protein
MHAPPGGIAGRRARPRRRCTQASAQARARRGARGRQAPRRAHPSASSSSFCSLRRTTLMVLTPARLAIAMSMRPGGGASISAYSRAGRAPADAHKACQCICEAKVAHSYALPAASAEPVARATCPAVRRHVHIERAAACEQGAPRTEPAAVCSIHSPRGTARVLNSPSAVAGLTARAAGMRERLLPAE